MSNIYKFAQELEVIQLPQFNKRRIGRNQDGGYVVIDEISKKTDVLYSYGVETDWSFEEEFVSVYDCEARLFDHTVEPITTGNPRIRFKKQGLGTETTGDLDTLSNHIRENDDLWKNHTLKMDIEWNEWDFFDSVPASFLQIFDQIICELHIIPAEYNGSHTPYFTGFHEDVYNKFNEEIFGKYLRCLKKIKEEFCLYHIHVNNSLGVKEYPGCKIPYLLEVSFINKKFLPSDIQISSEIFPIEGLDFPNKPYKPEVVNFYPFKS